MSPMLAWATSMPRVLTTIVGVKAEALARFQNACRAEEQALEALRLLQELLSKENTNANTNADSNTNANAINANNNVAPTGGSDSITATGNIAADNPTTNTTNTINPPDLASLNIQQAQVEDIEMGDATRTTDNVARGDGTKTAQNEATGDTTKNAQNKATGDATKTADNKATGDATNTPDNEATGHATKTTDNKATGESTTPPFATNPTTNSNGKMKTKDVKIDEPKGKKRAAKTDKITEAGKGPSKAKKVRSAEENDDDAVLDYENLDEEGKKEVQGKYSRQRRQSSNNITSF